MEMVAQDPCLGVKKKINSKNMMFKIGSSARQKCKKKIVNKMIEKKARKLALRSIESVKVKVTINDIDVPIIKVLLTLCNGTRTRASVPTAGIPYEDIVAGIMEVALYVNSKIGPSLVGKDPTEQVSIDDYMTITVQQHQAFVGTKQHLFRNAMFAVSLAVCRAGASVSKLDLFRHIANLAGKKELVFPVPAYDVMKAHSHPTNKLALQEYFLLPVGAPSFSDAMDMNRKSCLSLRKLCSSKFGTDASPGKLKDGFVTNIQDMKESLEVINTAIDNSGFTGNILIGVDVATSASASAADELYEMHKKFLLLDLKEEDKDSVGDSFKEVLSFVSEYRFTAIQDADVRDNFRLSTQVGQEKRVEIITGDLKRFNPAIKKKTGNAVVLKINQIGSVTECILLAELIEKSGSSCILATYDCGSGHIEDTAVADLSVGLSVDQVRVGNLHVGRSSIYNRLLLIEHLLGDVPYAGERFRAM